MESEKPDAGAGRHKRQVRQDTGILVFLGTSGRAGERIPPGSGPESELTTMHRIFLQVGVSLPPSPEWQSGGHKNHPPHCHITAFRLLTTLNNAINISYL